MQLYRAVSIFLRKYIPIWSRKKGGALEKLSSTQTKRQGEKEKLHLPFWAAQNTLADVGFAPNAMLTKPPSPAAGYCREHANWHLTFVQ